MEYGTDLTKQAEEGRLDPVVGRAKEIERVTQILGRRTKVRGLSPSHDASRIKTPPLEPIPTAAGCGSWRNGEGGAVWRLQRRGYSPPCADGWHRTVRVPWVELSARRGKDEHWIGSHVALRAAGRDNRLPMGGVGG
jgi:hypothetical protein